MIKIIYLILCLILGILLYQILKNICECNIEGFGLFGRAKLGKCCPMDYMYSDTDKKCVKICDGCAMGAYSPMTLKQEQYYGDSQPQLHAIFDCKENDSSEVYNYEKINRLYKKSDLMDQYDFGFNLDSEMMMSGSGVQAAEEGGNEAWAGVSTDASTSQLSSDTVNVSSEQQHYFEEIPEELYYTDKEECYPDYVKFIRENRGGPNVIPDDCRGHWKLDLVDQRYDYLKDGDRSIAVPSWRVYTKRNGTTSKPGYNQSVLGTANPETFEVNKTGNLPMVRKYTVKNNGNTDNSILNPESPVYKYYEEKYNILRCVNPRNHELFSEDTEDTEDTEDKVCADVEVDEETIDVPLTANRVDFCKKLEMMIEINGGDNIGESKSLNLVKTPSDTLNYDTLCPYDGGKKTQWELLCSSNNIRSDNINETNLLFSKKTGEAGEKSPLCIIQKDIEYLCKANDIYTGSTCKTFCEKPTGCEQ